ncbi:MATE family efflux transporter [Nocardioides limicola]|uniref:MATE family efflux transporter n=1 Tax=Nocardioides limicola TaxID=2803368 RepID=UPI00193B6971|nr:MATE family efflux transporter [Nocardioides sp. DJM-14]
MPRFRRSPATRAQDYEILRLAFPALLALITEPLFLLADAAIIGHLGTAELAGLGVAAVVLQTVVGMCIFLAYGTTAQVARLLGAGRRRDALSQGMDGVWLAVLIGGLATLIGVVAASRLVGLFGAGAAVTEHAETYLRISLLGVTPVLVMLAATGILRGLQDTRTPLLVAVVANVLNVILNVVLVYGVGPAPALGIAGAAVGSVIAQSLGAGLLLWVVARAARRDGSRMRPHLAGVRRAMRAGVPLVIRTLTLRAALLVTTYAAARLVIDDSGTVLAAHQLAFTLWTFLAFTLDAIAIAAQAITGRHLGAGDVPAARAATARMIQWGVASGVVTGLALAAVAPVVGRLFTPDPGVHALLVPVLVVAALAQPVAGVVFVLDGVLIGAGDGAYLAWGGLVVLIAYAPAALLVALGGGSLTWLWVAFAVLFMGVRCVVLVQRARGDRWLITGAA